MIRALIETSLIDWDGKIAMVLFFDRCNFNCPFCQNWELILYPQKFSTISFDNIIEKLQNKKNWVDGVVLTGGEPLVYKKEVFDISRTLKELGLSIKLDTNGAYPDILKEMINKGLVDYVAMDIKAALNEAYYIAVGKRINLMKIRESTKILLSNQINYEFRTTCVPGIIDADAIERIGNYIKGAKRWFLQAFVPENAYKEEYRSRKFDLPQLGKLLKIAQKYVLNAQLRGKL